LEITADYELHIAVTAWLAVLPEPTTNISRRDHRRSRAGYLVQHYLAIPYRMEACGRRL